MKKEIMKLTDLELSIMRVIWNSKANLTINQISDKLTGISVPSVTQAIKHLIKKNAVVVSEHILISNVYARTFKTCFTPEEYLEVEFRRLKILVYGEEFLNRKV